MTDDEIDAIGVAQEIVHVGERRKSMYPISMEDLRNFARAIEQVLSATSTQGADNVQPVASTLSDRELAFIDLLNHYDSTMRNVMALPSGRTQEQKDRARLALIKAFETRATPLGQEPVIWQDGVGMLWDVYSHGKFSKNVVSPIGWDAWSVYRYMVDVGKFSPDIDVSLADTRATPADQAAGFAVASGAAASLEDAAVCMRDPDAKQSAEGAAAFVRKRIKELWSAAPADHISQARDAVIEECAKVCEGFTMPEWEGRKFDIVIRTASAAMRALKSAPPEKPAGDI